MTKTLFLPLILALAFGCSNKRKAEGEVSKVSVYIPPIQGQETLRSSNLSFFHFLWASTSTPPTTVGGFSCLGLNVTGPGISSSQNLGILSDLIVTASGGVLNVEVPIGSARLFQVLGIVSDVGCPTFPNLASTTAYPYVFALGSVTSDIVADTALAINLSYNATTAQDLRNGKRPTTTVTPSGTNVTISPNTPQTVNMGGPTSFTVTPASGHATSSTVGGTCPAGSWSGDVYTTGTITGECSVSFSADPAFTVSVNVTLSGGTGLVLVNNTTNPTFTNDPTTTTPINANGTYAFTRALPTGATYNVTISSQPDEYNCTVSNATGTIAGANVSNINVICIANCQCNAGFTPDTSQLFCAGPVTSTDPGAFIPVQVGDTNGAYGPNGPWPFLFSESNKHPFKDTNGTLNDSIGGAITKITPMQGTFWNDRLNAISVKPNPEQIGKDYELSFCLNAPVNGQYVFGIASDNGMGFSVGGRRIFESSLNGPAYGTTFSYWWLGGINLSAGTYPVNFLWNNQGGPGALGFEFYQNTMAEAQAATALTDLTVISRSSTYIGQSVFSEIGTTCPLAASYNACTGKCEERTFEACTNH